MRTSNSTNYIDELYRERIDNLLEEVREEFPEEYRIFLKIKSEYVRNQATNLTIYSRLTRLRSACRISRKLFGKPLTQLTKDEWDILSSHLYSMYNTRDSIVSAIHPLRLTLKHLGYDKETIKELFPYPSSVKAKLQRNAPPPYVPGHVLDKVIFSIYDNMYRALFSLMRVTGARIEEIILLKRENILEYEDSIYVRFNITKNGLPREIPINWPGYENHLKTFLAWYNNQYQKDLKAWLFPRREDPSKPVPRNFAYLVLKRAATRVAKYDPEVRKYLDHIHPHQLRHTRAYELVFQNWNVRWIMYYMGWRKIDMVLRYTQAFELKQIYRMLNGNGNSRSTVKTCPRCHTLIPEGAKYCPYCGLKLSDHSIERIMQLKKDKEELKKLLLKLIEEKGINTLKELLISI